nr:sigma-70 family RNA polymerase sigma factor [Paenibacillus mucilaginosus]
MFQDHASYVYGIALMLTRSASAADDITQETFLRAYQKYAIYDPTRPVRPWLYRMTVNMSRSMLRRQRWLTFFGQTPEQGSVPSIEEAVLQLETNRELWELVESLTPKRKEVIVLFYYAGLPLPEVAEILGIRLGTCKSRLHAALEQLRSGHHPAAFQRPSLAAKEVIE